ncbi:dipeptide/oligopeptide/nickel ABC transporter permease/ATP-binding protein [Arthrobacter sp. W4I7]|uniref:dipeptide/oligopeptide/nickel ABC transporter permease/ATP-binding protein n=1 Tax=Arthrobacter sp. W4I7 TaxID=3042296 RepID=UPI002789F741|nr:dipeptide/oligopeptide/nickel ABC transporter permease/ATP-binding protein [Arthrobacter sp. W4I7]MDQ0691302.1 peptide/nickel transport system permease protein [Arthrobacter sp. W4I7]
MTTHEAPPDTVSVAMAQKLPPVRQSPLGKLLRDHQAVAAGVLLIIIIMAGVLASLISPYSPNAASLQLINAPLGTPGHPLGADGSGRDILSRLLHSINTSMLSALIGTGVALLIGVTAGLIGGYLGRRVRGATDWIFNLLMAFPGLLVLIILIPVTKADFRATMLLFGILLSPTIYRIVRNQVVAVKNELFVDAARVSGLSNLRILGRHVLFVVRGPIIIAAAFMANAAIGAQAGLAFLGLGSNSVPSFGAMIAEAFVNLYTHPLQLLWPSLMLGLITACLVLLGNSLRDALEGSRKTRTPSKKHRSHPRIAAVRAGAAKAIVTSPTTLLEIDSLAIGYPDAAGEVTEVVRNVSLTVEPGEIVGLVGESGSGKTQSAFAALGVLPREAIIVGGRVLIEGRDVTELSQPQFRALRGGTIAYVPQEPMSNLDPSSRIGAQLVEGLRASSGLSRRDAKVRILELLGRVGIIDPERVFMAYPHEVSGGMAQRALIAGAVAGRPKLLIADEPTTALDVTVQAEILDLLRDLQSELGMGVLLVTHNFGVVADLCDRLVVMRSGEVVETGTVREVFQDPQHPYTKMLLSSILDEGHVRNDPPLTITTAMPERTIR